MEAAKCIRECRLRACCCRPKSCYYCAQCRRLNKELCRGYHNIKDPLQEIEARLIYEYVFDIITEDDLKHEMIHRKPCRGSRDYGHYKRMKVLYERTLAEILMR